MTKLLHNRNKFDYPQISPTYRLKSLSPNQQIIKLEQEKNRKIKYANFIKNECYRERIKAKDQQYKKQQELQQRKKQQIKKQILEKKKQLQKLQKQRQRIIDEHGKAYDKALQKQHADKIRRLKSQQKQQQNDKIASIRYNTALRRLQQEKQINQFYIIKKQIENRKKARFEEQMKQKQLVRNYQKTIESRKLSQQKEKAQKRVNNFQSFKLTLGRQGYKAAIDYNQTCFHNSRLMNIIVENNQVQNKIEKNRSEPQFTAYESATKYIEHINNRKSQEKISQQKLKKKSIQRGKNALQKIHDQKQYEEYENQVQKMNVQYNLNKIQAGKKNQFVGIKRMTIQQMEKAKKDRCQEQFQKMFHIPDNNCFTSSICKQEMKQGPILINFIQKQNRFKLQQLQKKYTQAFENSQFCKGKQKLKYDFDTQEQDETLQEPRSIQTSFSKNLRMNPLQKLQKDLDEIKLQYSFSEQSSFY